MVELHYILGLETEAKKYATTLGYNYESSEWYKRSYKVFNKNYTITEHCERLNTFTVGSRGHVFEIAPEHMVV